MPNSAESEPRTQPKAWIVTTVFDRFEALQRYLACLGAQTYRDFALVLVDHGHKDVTEFIELPDYVVLLKTTPDKWWTAAANVGIDYVLRKAGAPDTDIVITQNDDSTFGPDFLEALVETSIAEKAVVGAVAVRRGTDRILHAVLKLDPWRAKYTYFKYGRPLAELGDAPMESHVLKGRGAAYPVGLIRKMGLMEERLPHYRSDHEWAHRARRYGARVLVTPKAVTEAVIDTQEKMNARQPFRQFWRLLFGRRSTANLRDAFVYYTVCYGKLKGFGLFVIYAVRAVTIFFLQMLRALVRPSP